MASISIKNKTYHINILLVDAVGVKRFKTKQSYDDLDKDTQSDIRDYIRKLVIKKDNISTNMIEDEIYLDCLEPKFKKLLLSLDNRQ